MPMSLRKDVCYVSKFELRAMHFPTNVQGTSAAIRRTCYFPMPVCLATYCRTHSEQAMKIHSRHAAPSLVGDVCLNPIDVLPVYAGPLS